MIPIANKDNNIEPIKALINPSTSNPGAIKPASMSSNALITNAKSPNVKNVIGKDIISRKGFIKVLISAIIIQTNIALKKFSTSIPGTIQDTKIIERA